MNLTYIRKMKTRNYKISNGISNITIFPTDLVYFIYMRIRSVVKTYELLATACESGLSPYKLLIEYESK